ncbi:unnamed protein product [Allacma fusca]|uniref:Uncharacterized protein n=1 Tax=Allacma fusca TaxID=39272 RepID=A0A8J2KQN9_9HEXA|nr:unnamed protein product [Allacma fusca]
MNLGRQAMLAAQRHGDDHPRSNSNAGPSLGNSLSSAPSDSMCHDNVDDDERVDVVGNDHRPDSVSPPPVRHHDDLTGADNQRRDDSDRDISDSGSESGGAFRPAARDLDHPSPNISLGPPLQPPMLPYLYPPNLYPGSGMSPLGPPPPLSLSLFGPGSQHSAASLPPSLLFNHLLQQQLLHGYPLAPPVSLASSLGPALLSERLKAHRFLPYPLIPPATASSSSTSSLSSTSTSVLGGGSLSAFETVTPSGHLSPKHSPRPPVESSVVVDPSVVNSVSPHPHRIPLLCMPGHPQQQAAVPPPPQPPSSGAQPTTTQHPSELKSIEKMVNGLDIKPDMVKHEVVDK